MPFGATVHADGADFALWAPSAEIVMLEHHAVAGETSSQPMTRDGKGWHRLAVPGVGHGDSYRYRLPDGTRVPDPASRFNPEDVHGPSVVIDPQRFEWTDGAWRGRPWEEAVVYELHVGTFTEEGSFSAARERLGELAELGITAIELMPLADFPGQRNWGYDGVLPFAPDASYGAPDELKALVDTAHSLGLMVLLDVVYNHFGPEGNYLHAYCPEFFNPGHQTPWGAAINFDGPGSRTVRDFFIHNALYWVEEFRFDGLRMDAIHAIHDETRPHIVNEIREALDAGPARERHVHLVLENDANQASMLMRDGRGMPVAGTAQWNDDLHHAVHVLATGERDGYYADYARRPGVPASPARWPRASSTRGSRRLSGMASGAASRARGCRRRRSCPSCRRTTRSATAPSASAFTRSAIRCWCARRWPACCCRRTCRCCSWATSSRPPRLSSISATSGRSLRRRCPKGGARNSAGSRCSRTKPLARAFRTRMTRRPFWPRSCGGASADARIFRGSARCSSCWTCVIDLIVPRLAGMAGAGVYRCENDMLQVQWDMASARLHLLAHFGAQPVEDATAPPGEVVYSDGATAGRDGALHLARGAVRVTLEALHGG